MQAVHDGLSAECVLRVAEFSVPLCAPVPVVGQEKADHPGIGEHDTTSYDDGHHEPVAEKVFAKTVIPPSLGAKPDARGNLGSSAVFDGKMLMKLCCSCFERHCYLS